jgi:hypothetical protein
MSPRNVKRKIKPGEKFDPKKHLDRREGHETVYKEPPGRGWHVGPVYNYEIKDLVGKVVKKGSAVRRSDPDKAIERKKKR